MTDRHNRFSQSDSMRPFGFANSYPEVDEDDDFLSDDFDDDFDEDFEQLPDDDLDDFPDPYKDEEQDDELPDVVVDVELDGFDDFDADENTFVDEEDDL